MSSGQEEQSHTSTDEGIEGADLLKYEQLTVAVEERRRRQLLSAPATHGFPELLSDDLVNPHKDESPEDHIERQKKAIYDFAITTLFLVEDGIKVTCAVCRFASRDHRPRP